MCGRFTDTLPTEDMYIRFKAEPAINWRPRYNIAPSDMVPVILNNDPKRIVSARWGIRPTWLQERGGRKELINARAETLLAKPTFRNAFQKRRCLIIADGFFEWKTEGRHKIPYYIKLYDGSLFAFAGLWESVESADSKSEVSCTIITTEPNDLMAKVHNRMPAILRINHESAWLDPQTSQDELMAMLHPYPASDMEAYPISTLVNSPANDMPDVIQPARH